LLEVKLVQNVRQFSKVAFMRQLGIETGREIVNLVKLEAVELDLTA